jgi:hypothetical protein
MILDPNTQVAQRNRRNAQLSTGPRTRTGKAVARLNSLKHGLTANPAIGVVEDPAGFEQLHGAIAARLHPSDPIEAGLVHRVATCLWRLQRAARIEAAAGSVAARAVAPLREEVQMWIAQINSKWWDIRFYVETDKHEIEEGRRRGVVPHEGPWKRFQRPYLKQLDIMREQTFMKNAACLTAMWHMLVDLARRIEQRHHDVSPMEIQLLGWLLGERAEQLEYPGQPEPERDGFYYPDEKCWAGETYRILGRARKRVDPKLPEEFVNLVNCRIITLRQQRLACEAPATAQQHADLQAASLLPDPAMLDRLLRYETHADRALHRALETLAKLRGASVDTVMARVAGTNPDGSTYEVQGRRSHWRDGSSKS